MDFDQSGQETSTTLFSFLSHAALNLFVVRAVYAAVAGRSLSRSANWSAPMPTGGPNVFRSLARRCAASRANGFGSLARGCAASRPRSAGVQPGGRQGRAFDLLPAERRARSRCQYDCGVSRGQSRPVSQDGGRREAEPDRRSAPQSQAPIAGDRRLRTDHPVLFRKRDPGRRHKTFPLERMPISSSEEMRIPRR